MVKRSSAQKTRPSRPRADRTGPLRADCVPGRWHEPVHVSPPKDAASLQSRRPAHPPGGHDQRAPHGVPIDLWRPADASRPLPRTGARRQSEAHPSHHGRPQPLGPTPQEEERAEPRPRRHERGSRQAELRRRRPERLVAHRHHRAQDSRRDAVLLCRLGPALPSGCGMGHRPAQRGRTGERRPHDGRNLPDDFTPDGSALRPRIANWAQPVVATPRSWRC